MPNQPPLNPDALEAAAKAVRQYEIDTDPRKDQTWYAPWDEADEFGIISEATKIEYREQAERIVSAYLAVAQPVASSVESIPAKMRMLMWEGGEFEVGEIPDGHVLVGFEMETDRAWSMADKVTINIERPEVKP